MSDKPTVSLASLFEAERERDELLVENERLRADAGQFFIEWGAANKEIERLRTAGLKLVAEHERLRVAAQAVIDSINDENEIDPDAVFRLSKTLGYP